MKPWTIERFEKDILYEQKLIDMHSQNIKNFKIHIRNIKERRDNE